MLIEKGYETLPSDKRWLASQRFPFWEAWDADKDFLIDICSKAKGLFTGADKPGGWTHEFMRAADKEHNKARSPAKSKEEKAALYQKAITYYGIAKFPIPDSSLRKDAYVRQLEMFNEVRDGLPYRLEKVRIPFGGKEIICNLYSPRLEDEITLPEAVLLTGGAEFYKDDLHPVARDIVNAGMVCLTIDMPGTGESMWKLSTRDSQYIYSQALKYLASLGNVDTGRIGIFGIGFGGYWALYSAAMHPEVKAAINVGGPVQAAFTSQNLKNLPSYLKKVMAFIQGYDHNDERDTEKALDSLNEFNLLKRIDLKGIAIPLLSINGSADPYVPIDDLFIIREEGGIGQDEWVFKEDGHCAPKHCREWMPRAVIWLANALGGKERIPAPDLSKL